MISNRVGSIICLICCALVAGCFASVPSKDVDNLNAEVKTYGKFIRWRAYDEAAAYLRNPDGQPINVDTEAMQEIRVTKYEVLTVIFNEDKTEAQVTAEISYYHERVNNVHTIQDKQSWWIDEDSGRWYINGPLPALNP